MSLHLDVNRLFERVGSSCLYFACGAGVYLLAWGEPDWHTTTPYVFLFVWPVVVIWWALVWVAKAWLAICIFVAVGGAVAVVVAACSRRFKGGLGGR